jgi:predicted short-subunit dehydrogenase-like oxidoreductase (DUF2520 family)
MRLGLIGAGKVGSTLARLWFKRGYQISAVSNRTMAKAESLAKQVNSESVSALELVKRADLVFLTVSDDAIEVMAQSLLGADWQDKAVVHTSGAASLDKLQSLAEIGAKVGSLHPIFPFADIETAIANLNGASFAIETQDETLRNDLYTLVQALDGNSIIIPYGKKALYHAALVFASNYTVTLYAVAERILVELGAEKATADNALNVLLEATVQNIITRGIPEALTGPLSRADIGTIQAHLALLEDETLKAAYRDLARLSYPMLKQRGIDPDLIERVLKDVQ